MSTDFATMQQRARLPEGIVWICVAGDLAAEHQAAEQALEREVRDQNSLEGGRVAELTDEVERIEEQMREFSYKFRLRGLPGRRFRRLKDEHPPRRTDDGDVDDRDVVGGHTFNTATFLEALVKVSVYDPKLSDEQWRELLGDSDAEQARREAAGEPVAEGTLTDAQIDALCNAALKLSMGDVDVPFSRAASLVRRNTSAE